MVSYFSCLNRRLDQDISRANDTVFYLQLFSSIFVLMRNTTVLLLISAGILLSCLQYFGEPIHCHSRLNQAEVVNDFCWFQPTFVLPRAWNKPSEFVPYPGIDNAERNKPIEHQAYYQWVPFALFLQGILFCTPHHLWKAWENGKVKALTLNLQHLDLSPDESKKNCELLAHALRIHWGNFSGYFRKYVLCQLLAFVNVTCQVLFLDAFLGGVVSNFGVIVLRWFQMDSYLDFSSPVQAFPKITKCTFHYLGPGGGFQDLRAMCLLPLNIFNEKLFIFLWFWMFALWFLAALFFICRLQLCAQPILRYFILRKEAPLVNTVILDPLVRHSKVSDWFVLYLLSKSISSKHYRSVINHLAEALEGDGRRTPFTNEETTSV